MPVAPEKPGLRFTWIATMALWVAFFFLAFFGLPGGPRAIPYSEFRKALGDGRVAEVTVSADRVEGTLKPAANGKAEGFATVRVDDPELTRDLAAHGVKITGVAPSSFWRSTGWWLIPIALLLFLELFRRLGQRATGAVGFGRARARLVSEEDVKVTFADVAGVDEAKLELEEVIQFLSHPERYRRVGGRIPKGVLLVGPPGTGKTLLARAVAGEAKVPFFSISGSEFVEMFVGVGAARVRDLFEQAKRRAPCIVFIDELDALGKARGAGPLSHEEREQTLNQLLVEMDGFDTRAGVILMAATNRPEILDPALLRAGRFDRHVLVDRPDRKGRRAILAVHVRHVNLAPDVDLDAIAAMTPGMVGADLANLVNEAALLAVRNGREAVVTSDLTEAVERVVAGLEKKSRILSPLERERVAFHEVGHAIVALSLPGCDPVHKISIIPRGISALGYTLQRPTEDRFLMTRSELDNKICVMLGGRVAEEQVFKDPSTGAQDDLVKATNIARAMVRSYGMSARLGAMSYEREKPPELLHTPFMDEEQRHGDEVERDLDREVRWIMDHQYQRASALLSEQDRALRAAAKRLIEKETLSGEELKAILAESERPHPAAATAAPVAAAPDARA